MLLTFELYAKNSNKFLSKLSNKIIVIGIGQFLIISLQKFGLFSLYSIFAIQIGKIPFKY